MRRFFMISAMLAAASCAPTTPRPTGQRTPLPAPAAPAAVTPAPRPVDWRDWPMTPGSWVYRRDDRSAAALFGQADAAALVVLRCDLPNRRLFLSRAGEATGPFTVRTSSTTRQMSTGATGGMPPYAAAVLPAGDPLFDAIAFSRGRFTLEQTGMPPLVLPVWAEIGRVIEDCR